MEVFKIYKKLEKHLNDRGNVGFVPTMGALHRGHLSLIKRSLADNPQTVVSIFVNPTQFDDAADLQRYPRTLAKDLELLQTLGAKLWVYTPEAADLYGESLAVGEYDFGALTKTMEGRSRHQHFEGVATVVEKLLRKVGPTKAYFGEKDFQQVRVIETLVAQKNLQTQIIRCPIVREADGLAMSSRNALLTTEERAQAGLLYQTLQAAKTKFKTQSIAQIHQWVQDVFKKNPQFTLDYFSICDETHLQESKNPIGGIPRGFIAAKLGNIRLIDNLSF